MERARHKSPLHGVQPNTGPLASAAWCVARDLYPQERNWFVEVALHANRSRFEIEIFSEEWGFALHHDERVSWIRVTDIPFVHGRDELDLLGETATLKDISAVLRTVERRFELAFCRNTATVRTSIADGESAIRYWIASL